MNTKHTKFFYILTSSVLLLALAFTSCVTTPVISSEAEEDALFAPETYIPQSFDWENITDGIAYTSFTSEQAQVSYSVVRIQLDTPKLTLCAYPGDGTVVSENGAYPVRTVSDFAREHNCLVAFNTAPFDSGVTAALRGVHIADGTVYSNGMERYAALAFTRRSDGSLRAQVIPSQTEEAFAAVLQKCRNATVLGGFFAVVTDGKAQHFAHHSYEARMGCGISADGKTLYILMVQKTNAFRGLSYQQCAKVFIALGCTNALEFDGGHSTELYVNGTTIKGTNPIRKQAAMAGFTLTD